MIYSPVFSAELIENTNWVLCLYPRGQDGNSVGYCLERKANDEELPEIEIYFDLIFLNSNSSVLHESLNVRHNFLKGPGYSVEKWMARENLNLPHDTLIARCKLRRFCGKTTNVSEQFARTIIKVDQKSFDWSIAEFNNMELDEKKSLSIPLTSAEDLLSLDLFLSAGEYSEKIILVSISSSLKTIKFVTIKLLLKDTEGNMVECGQKEFHCGEVENFKIIPLILAKNKFLRKNLYLKDGQLSLCCVCAFTTGIAHEGIERNITGNFNRRDEGATFLGRIVTEKQYTRCLKDDFKSLYNDLTLSDITLFTETKSYPAHIAILCARSPVFKAMFTSDMKERSQKHVDILDLDDDTVQRMLLYMYTDTLENLQWESALLLYKAADKYNIMSLRNQCASFIERHLSPINVCEALALVDMHQDEDFKRTLQSYIVDNQEEVLDSKKWELFMKNHSELAAGIMFDLYGKSIAKTTK
ncbi:kelch-like protein 6 [Trichonephila clavata]|uniref:Kelch-like protein 6 n=1 Tax=Trichonephila clavata TaxID=2740835 RepID=A0A8X6GPF9_TRICU|nr:kelch-like protein 6 [Trichonephila clavata]